MILVAENDEKKRKQIVDLIRLRAGMGLGAVGVGTGKELIWNLKNVSLDLLLINPQLPDAGKRIFDLIRKVRGSFSKLELPVLLMVEDSDKDTVLRGYEAGANDMVYLPYDEDIFLAQLRHHVSSRQEFKKVLVSYYRDNALDHDATVNIEIGAEEYEDSIRDRVIPCEIPMNLVAGDKPYFCKSIWMTHNSVLVLAFQDIPASEDDYRLRLRNPSGGQIELNVIEIRRETMRDTLVPGNLKLNLRIVDAPESFDQLFSQLQDIHLDNRPSPAEELTTPDNNTGEHALNATMMFSSADPSLSLVSGTRYRYVSELGRGSFASVYLVHDNLLKRNVAMKVLSSEYTKQDKARRNFLSEAQIAAQFHHSNIVFVYEVGEIFRKHYHDNLEFPERLLADHPQRLIYFTMQLVEGDTLTGWMMNNPNQDVEAYTAIMEKILDALAFAHQKGVTHRDIKPENIMINHEGQVLVADFGIATLAQTEEEGQDGKPTEIACTPKYAAPEQLLGEEMDGRSDLYSFGVMAYEMLAGKAPFGGRSLTDIARKHITQVPKPIRTYRQDIDTRLEQIVLKLLEKNKEDRFQSAEEVLEALAPFLGKDEDRNESVMDSLAELIDQAIVVRSYAEGARILEKLIAFLNLHKTSDNVDIIRAIRNRLSEASLVNLLIEKNLNDANFQLLYQFFSELDSQRAVGNLLQWFCRETDRSTKLLLGELAVISAGRDLKPLITFGLELADSDASLLLKSFGEVSPISSDAIYKEWSRHSGYQTQKELLKLITVLERDGEAMEILDLYVNGGGTVHPAIRTLANDLLSERLIRR